MGLFFISVGSQFDWQVIINRPFEVAVLTIGLILGKGLAIAVIAALTGYSRDIAIRAGILLGQGSEFGFAVLAVAITGGLLGLEPSQPIIGTTTRPSRDASRRFASRVPTRPWPRSRPPAKTCGITCCCADLGAPGRTWGNFYATRESRSSPWNSSPKLSTKRARPASRYFSPTAATPGISGLPESKTPGYW
jgi:hypothetical protein